MITPSPITQQSPPSEQRLKLLVTNGGDCIEIAQRLIDQHKLPYIIEKDEQGILQLRSSYTQGELYLRQFITTDPDTLQMKEDVVRMAKTPYEVLITGETGTGKELIAKAMIGERKGAIKCVNCAGLPRELIESELFGYVQGAFTGATKTTDGLMTLASNGVMFMDEVSELPMDMQAKLLRAIQDKKIRKVGGKVEEDITCKFVCATNRDLGEMVKEGKFRKDLYARISTLELFIKSLVERRCDVIPITESLAGGKEFLEKYREDLMNGLFDLSLNVRSIQQYVIRYSVLGRVVNRK